MAYLVLPNLSTGNWLIILFMIRLNLFKSQILI